MPTNSAISKKRTRSAGGEIKVSSLGLLSSKTWRLRESVYNHSEEAEFSYA